MLLIPPEPLFAHVGLPALGLFLKLDEVTRVAGVAVQPDDLEGHGDGAVHLSPSQHRPALGKHDDGLLLVFGCECFIE